MLHATVTRCRQEDEQESTLSDKKQKILRMKTVSSASVVNRRIKRKRFQVSLSFVSISICLVLWRGRLGVYYVYYVALYGLRIVNIPFESENQSSLTHVSDRLQCMNIIDFCCH